MCSQSSQQNCRGGDPKILLTEKKTRTIRFVKISLFLKILKARIASKLRKITLREFLSTIFLRNIFVIIVELKVADFSVVLFQGC